MRMGKRLEIAKLILSRKGFIQREPFSLIRHPHSFGGSRPQVEVGVVIIELVYVLAVAMTMVGHRRRGRSELAPHR